MALEFNTKAFNDLVNGSNLRTVMASGRIRIPGSKEPGHMDLVLAFEPGTDPLVLDPAFHTNIMETAGTVMSQGIVAQRFIDNNGFTRLQFYDVPTPMARAHYEVVYSPEDHIEYTKGVTIKFNFGGAHIASAAFEVIKDKEIDQGELTVLLTGDKALRWHEQAQAIDNEDFDALYPHTYVCFYVLRNTLQIVDLNVQDIKVIDMFDGLDYKHPIDSSGNYERYFYTREDNKHILTVSRSMHNNQPGLVQIFEANSSLPKSTIEAMLNPDSSDWLNIKPWEILGVSNI